MEGELQLVQLRLFLQMMLLIVRLIQQEHLRSILELMLVIVDQQKYV